MLIDTPGKDSCWIVTLHWICLRTRLCNHEPMPAISGMKGAVERECIVEQIHHA